MSLEQKLLNLDIEFLQGVPVHLICLIDLWPSRMTYHIIKSELPERAGEWPRLSFDFNVEEFDNLLNGVL